MFENPINDLIRNREIVKSYNVDRKTYWSYASYKAVAETNDLRYDYAFMMDKKWPGASSIEDWIKKLPVEVNGRLIDYGRGQNKIEVRCRAMSEDMLFEYQYFHLPEGDHYPIPRSKGGQFEFDNCVVRPKIANMQRQNLEPDELIDALRTTIISYNLDVNAIIKDLK